MQTMGKFTFLPKKVYIRGYKTEKNVYFVAKKVDLIAKKSLHDLLNNGRKVYTIYRKCKPV